MKSDTKSPQRQRRRRRSQEEILKLIRTSALRLFAERGYMATKTLEIARLADVSETLVFSHFGSKANLYDDVVSEPFKKMMTTFVEDRRRARLDPTEMNEPEQLSGELYDFFDQNREVFSALALAPPTTDDQEPVRLTGLDATFKQAAQEVIASYEAEGLDPPFNADIAVRLAFGMVAASVMLRYMIFSASDASSEDIRDCVMAMISRALWKH